MVGITFKISFVACRISEETKNIFESVLCLIYHITFKELIKTHSYILLGFDEFFFRLFILRYESTCRLLVF